MNKKEAWMYLDHIPNIGPITIYRLLKIFKTPENILKARAKDLRTLPFLKNQQIKSLVSGPDMNRFEYTTKILNNIGGHTLTVDDILYPVILKQIPDPPPVLYYKGDIRDIQPAVAVVGTRAPSHYGKEMAYAIARDLSMSGISIVSGLARGIDTASHKGALKGGGKTVAVLGTGLDIIYPRENRGLSEEIVPSGCLVTEFFPGIPPEAKNFPRRNRIISGLSIGTVVIEAALKSGAMITARFAGEQGRMCMALPGSVTNIRSKGPHKLIREGATLVESASDVLMEIAPQLSAEIKDQTDETIAANDPIKDALDGDALSMGEIEEVTGMDISYITKQITMLELKGEVARIEGNRFVLRRRHG